MNALPPQVERSGIVHQIQGWFYAKEVPYSLALVRILTPLAMLLAIVPRWPHVREMYSSDGAPAPFWEAYGMSDLLPIFSPDIAMALYTVMVLLCLAVCIGWKTRLSIVALTLLIAYFGLLDALGTLTKYTVFACHIFMLLAFSECGSIWSVDAWIKRNQQKVSEPPRVEIWPQRLIQLLIGIVYLSSAITKVQTEGYFSGDQVFYWTLTNANFHNPLGEWLSAYPSMIVLFGYMTVVWEVLFVFLIWRDPARKFLLAFGLVFHALTYFLLGLMVFPVLYFAVYSCFLQEAEARKVGGFFSSLLPRQVNVGSRFSLARMASWPAFGAILLGASLLSIAAERKMDVYRENGPEGRFVLQPLSTEAVKEITSDDRTIRVEDQLYSVEIGASVVGGYVFNPKTHFKAGEEVSLQARLIHPHSDVWVEYTIRDSQGRVVAREGNIAPREEYRQTFPLQIGKRWETGDYHIIVKLNGKTSAQRTIHIENPQKQVLSVTQN